MTKLRPLGLCCILLLGLAAWLGTAGSQEGLVWKEVTPGVLRSPGLPACHALIDGDACLLIDAPLAVDGIKDVNGKKIEHVLLTHHHWDTCIAAGKFLEASIPVRAGANRATG